MASIRIFAENCREICFYKGVTSFSHDPEFGNIKFTNSEGTFDIRIGSTMMVIIRE